ncbi:MAG TPA: EamA family transporter [Pyrinomonadaceae bacterium]|jgi:drug/metabolite transporter (DMT)-like permease|nr:EamA family transporter [Pyrinomonadaceae bacterium]
MSKREKIIAYCALAAVFFFWGTTYLAIRVGLETLPPTLLAGMRFLTAGTILFLFMRGWRKERLPVGREWLDQALVGLMLLGVGNGLVVWAEVWIPSGMAALLVATSPFWVVGFERLRSDGERVRLRALVGMLVGFGGLVLLVAPGLFGETLSMGYLLGMAAIQVACASWSGGSVYTKHHRTRVAPLMGASLQMLFAGLAMTLLGTALGEWRGLYFSERSLAALAYLTVFGSIVAYGSYTYAVQKLPLSVVSTYSYVNPVIAVLLGWLVLAEPLGWRMIAAMLIILGGVALVKTAAAKQSDISIATTTTTTTTATTTASQGSADEALPRAETLPRAEACSVATN